MDTPLTPFTLALDWTPNVNHAGFFVAHSRGLYAARGLDVQFVSPAEDNYTVTPAEKVSDGSAQLAICPSESIISYATKVRAPVPQASPAASVRQTLTNVMARLYA